MIDRNVIGKESEPVYYEIEKGAIAKFADAIGDENPIYFDEDAAKAKGYKSIPAPLTFPTTFRTWQPEWYEKIDKSKLLHAEQEYIYQRRLCAGEKIKCVEKVTNIYEKQGKNGKLTFIVREKNGFDQNNDLVFTEIQTLVIRGEI